MLDFLNGLAVPERQVLAWFQPQRPEHFQQDNFPVFNLITDEGRFYGFPVHGVPGFKIGRYHHFEESGPASEIDFEVYPEDEAMLRDVTSRYFPDAVGPTMTLKACMFVNSPDGHFLLDLHPALPAGQLRLCLLGPRLQVRERDRRDPGRPRDPPPDAPRHRPLQPRALPRCRHRGRHRGTATSPARVAAPSCRAPGSRARRASGEATACGRRPARARHPRLPTDPRLAVRPERDLPVPMYAASESERRRAEQDWKVWSPWG